MKYRRLGQTGLMLSEISLGTWVTFGSQIQDQTANNIVHVAFDQGVNYFDTADAYADGRAEIVLGGAIRDLSRTSLVIASKVFFPTMNGVNGRGLSRKHIMESCHASLRRLGTDYIDLYYCHRFDPNCTLEETIRAMDDLVHQGKVLYWGTSEWQVEQIANACELADSLGCYHPAVEQPQYNVFLREIVENELIPAVAKLGFGLVTWSPLRSGLLTGKYSNGIPNGARFTLKEVEWLRDIINDTNIKIVRLLTEIANDLGITTSQLAIGWLLRNPQITSVITGATAVEQLMENLGAIEVYDQLTPDLLQRIDSILVKQPELT